MPKPRRVPRSWNRFGHWTPYHLNNDLAGLDKTVSAGLKRHDLDAHMSKDGVVVLTHWDQPLRHGFYDPLHITRKSRKVSSMSYRHLSRLRTKGGHRIRSAWTMFREAAARGLTVELELKLDKRFEDVDRMRQLKRVVDGARCKVVVKTLTSLPGAPGRLRAAYKAGFATIVLPRSEYLNRAEYWPWARFVRGKVKWTGRDTDDRYQVVTFRGRRLDRFTVSALLEAERTLGYPLTLAQGSYNGTKVKASAGTHSGGGALDVTTRGDYGRAVLALRRAGFAAWHRTPAQGPWRDHIHAVQIGNTKAAPSAQRQVTAYRNGRNGLANNGPDNGPRVPIRAHQYQP